MLTKNKLLKEEINVWPGYVDAMSISLFVILLIFVVAFIRYQYLGFLVGKGENDIQTIKGLFQQENFKLKEGKIIIQEEILFGSNRSELTPEGKLKMRKIGEKLKKFFEGDRKGKFSLVVEGHTDTQGNYEHNLQLSFDRAKAVTDFWKSELNFGTAEDNSLDLFPAGYGKTRLAVATADNINEARNRRIEIRIVPKFDAMLQGWIK
jgi:outer membrane protein OmpA-like peptidoglycan-associated protein